MIHPRFSTCQSTCRPDSPHEDVSGDRLTLYTQFDDNWTTSLEAAFGISGEQAQKIKNLQAKMRIVGMEGLKDIIYGDFMKSDVEQITAWPYRDGN